eukprot:g47440.t1
MSASMKITTMAVKEADPSDGSGLGTGAIVGILIVVFLILLVAVDVTCYFINKCGLLMCIAVNFCGQPGPGSKGKDMEEGKAAFSKDESKEPIVEVRTEEERTPNHDGGSQTEPNETTPLTEPDPGNPASPPATSAQQQSKPEAPTTTKSPEIEAAKPNPVKSPVEPTNNSTSVKNEAATDSSKKPSQ